MRARSLGRSAVPHRLRRTNRRVDLWLGRAWRPEGRRARATYRALVAATVALLAVDVVAFHAVANRGTPVALSRVIARYRAAAAKAGPGRSRGGAGDPGAAPASPSAHGAGAAPSPAAAPSPRPGPGGAPTAPAPAGSHSGPAPAPAPAALEPDAGVYLYRTSGHESVSALGGSRHDYPDRSTITVTRSGCGSDLMWQPLEQRYETFGLCAHGRELALRQLVSYHNFFGRGRADTYLCSPGTDIRPEGDAPGATFDGVCRSASSTVALHGTVVGTETVMVGADAVPSLHVHLAGTLNGDVAGTRRDDLWLSLATNTIVRYQLHVDAMSATPIGRTHYDETASLQLTALVPQR